MLLSLGALLFFALVDAGSSRNGLVPELIMAVSRRDRDEIGFLGRGRPVVFFDVVLEPSSDGWSVNGPPLHSANASE